MVLRCFAVVLFMVSVAPGAEKGEAEVGEERALMEKQLFPLLQQADEVVLYSLYPVAEKHMAKEPDRNELRVAFGVGRTGGPGAPSEADKRVAALARKAELFEGFPVLGKEVVKEAPERAEILAAIRSNMLSDAEDPGSADCFEPHHGILVRKDDVILRFTLCFLCSETRLAGAPPEAKAGMLAFNHFKKDFAAWLNARFKAAELVHPPYNDHPPEDER